MDTILSDLTSPRQHSARQGGVRICGRSGPAHLPKPENPAIARQSPLEFGAARSADRAEYGPSEAPSLSVITSPRDPGGLVGAIELRRKVAA